MTDSNNEGKGRRRTKQPTKRDAGMTRKDEAFIVRSMNEAYGQPQFVAEVMPEPTYLDRTKPDRDRFMERIKPQITKDHIKELLRRGGSIFGAQAIGGEPVFQGPDAWMAFQGVTVSGDSAKEFVPETGATLHVPTASLPIGVGEPRWRPGRDRPGAGGGGPDASDDPSDLVFLDLSYEELAELLAVLFDLPFLLAKDEDKILAYTMKVRGIKKNGPEARLDLESTFAARLERWRATVTTRPEEFPGLAPEDIPSVEEFPYDQIDLRYKRVEEKWDPDSKAVVFFELDTSGSMGGEPLAIAKFYFLLNLIWLRARYGEVDVVYVPHNAEAFRVDNERDFFRIQESGGTMFIPAHELCMEIAAREYPANLYNRYAFHATDGYNFEPPQQLAEVLERMVTEGQGDFNFFGYLEIDTYGWGGGRSLPGMQAIMLMSEGAKSHCGWARVKSQDEVPDAMKQIVDKDPAASGN